MTEVRIPINDDALGLPVAEKHHADETTVLVEQFCRDHLGILERGGENTIVFDMSGVPSSISSSVVVLMISLMKKANAAAGNVRAKITDATPQIMEKLGTMQLHKMFSIEPRKSMTGEVGAES